MKGEFRMSIATLDAITGNATSWNPDPQLPNSEPYVMSLAIRENTVYVGGDFMSIGGQDRAISPHLMGQQVNRFPGIREALINA